LSGIKLVIIKQLTLASALRSFPETVSLALELIGVAIIVYGAIVTIIFLIKAEARAYDKLDRANTESSSSLRPVY
jgi:uncharacterized membrane protein (DUF485 family)